MNIAVRYHSRSGNTRKLAEAIAKTAGVRAENCAVALTEPVDLLFLGGSIYANGVDGALKKFIQQLTPAGVKCVAVFGTSALKKEPHREIEALVHDRGIALASRGFHCRGSFTLVHRGHPDDADVKSAADFAQSVMKEYKGEK